MGTLLNRRRYMGGGDSLPYDAEVQYLVTTKSSTLDTNINNTDIGYIRVVKQYASTPSGQQGDGCYVSSPRFYGAIGYVKQGLGMQFSGSGGDRKVLDFDTNEHTWIVDVINAQGTVDSTTITIPISSILPGTFIVNGYSPQRVSGTMYKSVELYNMSMVKILDLIPIRKGQQGGWYDQVSGELMGVGVFTAGPDKIGGVNT